MYYYFFNEHTIELKLLCLQNKITIFKKKTFFTLII